MHRGRPLRAVVAAGLLAALLLAGAAGARLVPARLRPGAPGLPARERPFHAYSSEFSPAMIETAATARVGQARFVGSSFLVQVTEMRRLAGPQWGAFAPVAKDGEVLRLHIAFEHPAGCAGFGAASAGIGVGVALAYQNGYDSERGGLSVVEGTCSVDPAQSLPPGWRSAGVCQFSYKRAWGPRYLVLSFIEDGAVHPQVKIPVD